MLGPTIRGHAGEHVGGSSADGGQRPGWLCPDLVCVVSWRRFSESVGTLLSTIQVNRYGVSHGISNAHAPTWSGRLSASYTFIVVG